MTSLGCTRLDLGSGGKPSLQAVSTKKSRPSAHLRVLMLTTVMFITLVAWHKLTMKKRMHMHLKISNAVAKTLYAIDQHAFLTTDFTDYIATLAYFRSLILVISWPRSLSFHTFKDAPETLGPEDFASFRDSIDATFAKLAAMPDSPKRQSFHRKLRTTCRDLHSFLYDFTTPDPETGIVPLYTRPVEEMTMDQKWTIAMVSFGTSVLIGTAWWYRPKFLHCKWIYFVDNYRDTESLPGA